MKTITPAFARLMGKGGSLHAAAPGILDEGTRMVRRKGLHPASRQPHTKALPLVVFCVVFLLSWTARGDEIPRRQRINFDADWRFQKDDPAGAGEDLSYLKIKEVLLAASARSFALTVGALPTADTPTELGKGVEYTRPNFDDSHWRHLDLPHDWGIEGPFKQEYPTDTGKLPYWGVGWYRKHFDVPAADAGGRCCLEVDGAMSYATVWCNGCFVGGWPYGYASWQVDLTPFLKPGVANVLAIRLDNPSGSSRWYPGGGIYRHVWLEKAGPVQVAHWGSHVTTPEVSDEQATVTVSTTLDNRSDADTQVNVRTEVFESGADGHPLGGSVASTKTVNVAIRAGSSQLSSDQALVTRPKRWDLQQPNLYVAVTTVEKNGVELDRCETIFGIRTILFTPDNGFLLNGKRVQIQGVCNHADLGALGMALNDRALQRQLELLHAMGCNAIRTSHNPPAPELLDLCDRMGFLVMDESFDMWHTGKRANGYNLLYDDWHERDQRALVRRDRNHPCVVLWSVGNEVPEQSQPQGPAMAAQLAGAVRQEDYTRPVSVACNRKETGFIGWQTAVDVFGYNYRPEYYESFRAANPTVPLFGSETASTESSRGEYFFPVDKANNGALWDNQVSSYDIEGNHLPDAEFESEDRHRFAAGEFVWTGFDYLGEPSPYLRALTRRVFFHDPALQAQADKELKDGGKIPVVSRSSYFGILDLAGFPKDRYYLYQSRWRPELPMAHLLPHWTWPDRVGQTTPVYVYTSGDEAELFLNGQSLGRKKKDPFQYRLQWNDVKYVPGELKVVAYKGGKPWANDLEHTAGSAARLVLSVDRDGLAADGKDLSFVSVTIADSNSVPVPQAHNRIRFRVDGPADIVATDNGDATSFESFQSPARGAFNGKCLVILRTLEGKPGRVTLTAEADGLPAASVGLVTRLKSTPDETVK